MTARFIVADVFDGLASLETGSVDVVITSPPFLALRSYLPADHPDKGKKIGSEATPAEFIDTLLKVTAELRRVLAPHGSLCVELGDTYAGIPGGDGHGDNAGNDRYLVARDKPSRQSHGWPLAKSRTLIPSLYQIALAYGFNPLTGQPSPAGQWRIRNVVTWARPNPPVGALGDKWRPATSDLIVACTSSKRYWDDLATRNPFKTESHPMGTGTVAGIPGVKVDRGYGPSGAPLLDYWVIPPGGYTGAHYAVFPDELVVPCVKAMAPPKVCRTCGEVPWRIMEMTAEYAAHRARSSEAGTDYREQRVTQGWREGRPSNERMDADYRMLGWTDCGHDDWRPALILDPFAGSGTTLAVSTGHGHDAIGIDIDQRNYDLALDRIGPFLFEGVDATS